MFENLIPDAVFSRISDISPEWLLEDCGVSGVICDLDNPLAGYMEKSPSPELSGWFARLREAGLKALILSNNKSDRVMSFASKLGVSAIRGAGKPRTGGFVKAAAMLGLAPERIAVIGDQIFTDVYGAKKSGMPALLVGHDQIDKNPLFWLRRAFESPFISRCGNVRV